MEWYRKKKRSYNKRHTYVSKGVFGNWGRLTKLSNGPFFPYAVALTVILAVTALGLAAYFIVIPWYVGVFRTPSNTAEAKTTPTPIHEEAPTKPIKDMTGLMQEYIFRLRYIHQPTFCDDEIACTSGEAGGNPHLEHFYIFNINKPTLNSNTNIIEEITLVNDNLFNTQINRKWLAWADHKNGGGGTIFVMDRHTREVISVKNYYGYAPNISLDEDYLCWSEQMDKNTQCVVLYDLNAKTHSILDVQKDMPFLYGGVFMRGGLLVWSGPDADAEQTDAEHLRGASINTFDVKNPASGIVRFSAGMYVYHPVTNGSVTAWADTNSRPGSGLYIKVGENQPRIIDDSVLSYSLGDDFIAYDKNGIIYLYFWEDASKAQLTKSRLKTWLIGCNGRRVLWYDLSDDIRARNIVKYAEVE